MDDFGAVCFGVVVAVGVYWGISWFLSDGGLYTSYEILKFCKDNHVIQMGQHLVSCEVVR